MKLNLILIAFLYGGSSLVHASQQLPQEGSFRQENAWETAKNYYASGCKINTIFFSDMNFLLGQAENLIKQVPEKYIGDFNELSTTQICTDLGRCYSLDFVQFFVHKFNIPFNASFIPPKKIVEVREFIKNALGLIFISNISVGEFSNCMPRSELKSYTEQWKNLETGSKSTDFTFPSSLLKRVTYWFNQPTCIRVDSLIDFLNKECEIYKRPLYKDVASLGYDVLLGLIDRFGKDISMCRDDMLSLCDRCLRSTERVAVLLKDEEAKKQTPESLIGEYVSKMQEILKPKSSDFVSMIERELEQLNKIKNKDSKKFRDKLEMFNDAIYDIDPKPADYPYIILRCLHAFWNAFRSNSTPLSLNGVFARAVSTKKYPPLTKELQLNNISSKKQELKDAEKKSASSTADNILPEIKKLYSDVIDLYINASESYVNKLITKNAEAAFNRSDFASLANPSEAEIKTSEEAEIANYIVNHAFTSNFPSDLFAQYVAPASRELSKLVYLEKEKQQILNRFHNLIFKRADYKDLDDSKFGILLEFFVLETMRNSVLVQQTGSKQQLTELLEIWKKIMKACSGVHKYDSF